jgi:hypothetical protein
MEDEDWKYRSSDYKYGFVVGVLQGLLEGGYSPDRIKQELQKIVDRFEREDASNESITESH